MGKLKESIKENGRQILLNTKLQDKQGRSLKEQVRTREKLVKLMQEQVKMQRTMKQFEGFQTSVGGGNSDGGGFLSKLGGLRGGLAGGLLAGGLYAMGRARKAAATFQQGIDTRIALRGRGVGNMELEDPNRAARAGMSSQDVRRSRLSALGTFGKDGASQTAVIQRAEFERNKGIPQGTLGGLGGQLRGNLGGKGADKAVMTIQAGLIASGITDEIGPYLETAASMLTNLSENGFTLSDSALTIFNGLIASGLSAERSGRMISGINQGIKGSTGEANAFFQKMLANAGIGGKSILGLQTAIGMGGFVGTDLGPEGSMSRSDRRTFEGIGLGATKKGEDPHSVKIAKAAITFLDKKYGTEAEINKMLDDPKTREAGQAQRLSRNRIIQSTFGAKDAGGAARINKMLMDLANPKTTKKEREKIEKEFKNVEAGKTNLGNLKAINESNAGQLKRLESLDKTVLDTLGAKMAPATIIMKEALVSINQSVLAIMDSLGIKTPAEVAKDALKTGTIDQKSFDLLGDDASKQKFSKSFANELAKKEKEVKRLDAETRADREAGKRLPISKMSEILRAKNFVMNARSSISDVEGLNRPKVPQSGTAVMMRGTGTAGDPSSIMNKIIKDVIQGAPASPKNAIPMARATDAQTKLLTQMVESSAQQNRISEKIRANTTKKGTIKSKTGGTL